MAKGKLVADEIEHSETFALSTQFVIRGSAKSWVNFNGTSTVSIRTSLNSSGLVDDGAGKYHVNFTNNMSGNSYCVSGSAGTDGSTNPTAFFSTGSGHSNNGHASDLATGSYTILITYATANPLDYEIVCGDVNGDLG